MTAPVRTVRCLTALVAVICCALGAAQADTWLAVSADGTLVPSAEPAQAPQLTRPVSDLGGLELQAQIAGLALDSRSTAAGEFISIHWPDSEPFGAIGAPALPVIRRLFVIPQGATLSVQYDAGAPITVERALLGERLVMPVQPSIEKIAGARENAAFVLDEAAYAVNADVPAERVYVEELGEVRGQRLAMVELRPVSYNPVSGDATLYPNLSVAIRFDGGYVVRDGLNAKHGLSQAIVNPEVLPTSASRGTGNYLIITTSTYEAQIAPFASFKDDQGYNVSTYIAPPGSTNTALKTYIAAQYAGANPPDYLLLVGDTNTIPAWVGGGEGAPDTDIQYGCMGGASDWYPDIAIGRFSVRTAAQLTAILNKVLYYETNMFADPAYLKRAVFMASNDNYSVSEGTHNYVINTYMLPNGYTVDKLYCHTYSATTQQVTNAFNNGRFFGIYSGHGSDTSWADGPVFSQANVNALTNVNMYPFVCSFACVTGSYENNDECFMETWQRAANKAAVIALGSSVNSYWDEDDILERKLFDVIFDESPTAVAKDVGPILDAAKLLHLAYYGPTSTTRRYFEMYNIMGDPATWIVEEPIPPTGLWVTPPSDLAAEGNYGGPFTPSEQVYTLENRNEVAMDYAVSTTCNWVGITNATGTIPAGGTVDVTVYFSAACNHMDNGVYTTAVSFENMTDHDGDTTRDVTVTIGVPGPVHAFNMDTNPGWTTQNLWAWGQNTGAAVTYGYPDPTSGHTGTTVYGYNLAGLYQNSLPETHLTTLALDCTGVTQTTLRFWRWLNIESPSYDHAYVRISSNGTNWTTLWQNTAQVTDNAWQYQQFDIAQYADNQATVYVRWTLGQTDSSWQFSGWNVDDVELWGLTPANPFVYGDMNCDNIVDFADINPFVDALLDPALYTSHYPNCDILHGDMSGNDAVGFEDINLFVEAIIGPPDK